MAARIALLTSCSVSRNFDPVLRIQDAPICKTMDELHAWWTNKMKTKSVNNKPRTPGELYAGLAFNTITEIAQEIGRENIFIVTGGVGLVRLTDKILPYDFTSDKKAEFNAHQHVSDERFIPHLWWNAINGALRNNSAPIAALADDYDVIVGALPKAFVKYIVRDLEKIGLEDLLKKVFLLLPRSTVGSIPKSVRNAIVSYGTNYAEDLSANRYDKPQRVARKFIRVGMAHNDGWGAYADTITERAHEEAMSGSDEISYEELFKQNPGLLECDDVGLAIHRARGLGIKIGGRHRFAGAWRGAKGQIALKFSKSYMNTAKKNLKTVLADTNIRPYSDNEQLLERLGLFVQAVREDAPIIIFTPKEVAAWGKLMHEDDLDLQSSTKVSYILAYHTRYLGLERISIGSTYGYRVTT